MFVLLYGKGLVMYRSDRDESNYSDARLLAWECVFPYKLTPILESDRSEAKQVEKFITKTFTKQEMKAAVERLKLRSGK